MHVMVYTEYGSPDALKLAEVAAPAIRDDDVLIRVHAAGVNAGDWHLLRGEPFPVRLMAGLRRPKPQNLAFGRDPLVAGRLAPAIDRCYPLGEAAEALRYLGTHRARGKVVITVGQEHAPA